VDGEGGERLATGFGGEQGRECFSRGGCAEGRAIQEIRALGQEVLRPRRWRAVDCRADVNPVRRAGKPSDRFYRLRDYLAAAVPDAAPVEAASAVFDIERISVTDMPLGEFPFFTPPERLKYTSIGRSELREEESLKKFDCHYFVTSAETLHPVEGKTIRLQIRNVKRNSASDPGLLKIECNYENAITAASGVKAFDGETSCSKTHNALDRMDRSRYGSENQNGKRQVYVIRKPGAEIWVEVSCSSRRNFRVTQKGEMKQSIGLIPASALKEALDKDGRIALYSKKLATALQGCRSDSIGEWFLSPPQWLRSKPWPSGRGSNLRTALKGGVSNRS
jgi:hypothetical protein